MKTEPSAPPLVPGAKDRLTQEQSARNGGYTQAFGYDNAGNPTSFRGVTRTFNVNNQENGIVHDGNGNPAVRASVPLTFDLADRLTNYGSILSAAHNGDGLRTFKQTSAGRTYFVYDG